MPKQEQQVSVWDPWIRCFHWALVGAIAFLVFSGKTGTLFFDYHRYVGEGVLAIIFFRLLWGVVGTSNTKVRALIRSPRAALAHLKDFVKGTVHPERGHNAAGSWSVLLLLALVSVQAFTGLFSADEDELIEGALRNAVSSDFADQMVDLHHTNANFLLAAIGLHIAALIGYRLRARLDLVTPMFTGKMRWPQDKPVPDVIFGSARVAVLCAAIAAVLTGWLLDWF